MDNDLLVIIPANNEEDTISGCLGSLPSKSVHPVVVANGCTDNTAELALKYGATTYELEIGSKLGAIQYALRKHWSPGRPFVILDADSRILFSKQFASLVIRKTLSWECVVLNGILAYSPEADESRIAYIPTLARIGYVFKHQYIDRVGTVTGQAEIIKPNEAAFDAILAFPSNIWPGEDIALADAVYKCNGDSILDLDPRLTVVTNRRGMGRLSQRILHPKAWAAHRAKWWDSRAHLETVSYAEHLAKVKEDISPQLAHKMMYMPMRIKDESAW